MNAASFGENEAAFFFTVSIGRAARLAHEKLHIDDVRTMTERYVDTLGRESFATRDRCEASALAASTNFEQTIREVALRSNAERHPNLVRLARK